MTNTDKSTFRLQYYCLDSNHNFTASITVQIQLTTFTASIPDTAFCNEFANFSFGHNSIVKVESSILPLDWAVHVQHVA